MTQPNIKSLTSNQIVIGENSRLQFITNKLILYPSVFFTIDQILQKSWEFDIETDQLLVKQTNDCIDHNILLDLSVSLKLIRLLRSTLQNNNTMIKVCGNTTEWSGITQGLQKVDLLAPVLFNLTLH